MFPHPIYLMHQRLMDEDSPTDEEASPVKRKRQSIKSGRLRTQDTNLIHWIKWPNEMVCCSQGKAPIYEDMSLASFANGWWRKGPPSGSVS